MDTRKIVHTLGIRGRLSSGHELSYTVADRGAADPEQKWWCKLLEDGKRNGIIVSPLLSAENFCFRPGSNPRVMARSLSLELSGTVPRLANS